MSSREIIERLEREGWRLTHVRRSHHHFKHPGRTGRATVPHPRHDLPVGTIRSIERQAGVHLRPER